MFMYFWRILSIVLLPGQNQVQDLLILHNIATKIDVLCGTPSMRVVVPSACALILPAHCWMIFGLTRSIDSMIRRLTRRTELEIVAQWPKEGDIADGEATAYITSLLGDCSPDMENERKLSSRAPEELMRLLVSHLATSHDFLLLLGTV